MGRIRASIAQRVVPKWYKKWSVQLSAFFLILSGAIMATPPQYLEWMPDWMKPLAFVVIIIAASIRQKNLPSA